MKKYIIYIACVLAGFQSCLDIKLENQFSDPYAITTVATARELLASAYSSFPRYQFEFSVLSDDFKPTSYANQYAELQNLHNWQDAAITDLSSLIWNEYYLTVAYLNALLTRLDNVAVEDESEILEREKVRSEALALKAWCYFDLLRIYGPVYSDNNLKRDGIILKNRLEMESLPRSTVEDCAAEIDRLLTEASKTVNTGAPVYYLGSEAVAALRAEFELYRGEYDKVTESALPLLSGIGDRLGRTAYENLWSSNESSERIFAPYIFDSFYTNLSYDKERGDYFVLSDAVTYEDTDVRKQWSEYQTPMADARSLGKYNRMYYENTEVRYINSLRYSGVLLTAAEAYARTGRDSEAVALMNTYLAARGLDSISGDIGNGNLIERILSERHKEFVGEGVRYFDRKRTGFRSDDYRSVFPIPQMEYKYNEFITEEHQNPGWAYEKTN